MKQVDTQPLLPFHVLRSLTADGRLLFATRCARMFAYGMLSVILVFYLTALGFDDRWGTIISAALLGDIAVSLWITTSADRVGRKKMLILGALLMAGAGLVFAATDSFLLLLLAATIGVVSPSDKEVGPFLSIEQSALSQTVSGRDRTAIFAWYNLAGSVAAALGTLTAGFAWKGLLRYGLTGAGVYRPIVWAYAGIGILLAAAFVLLGPAAEAPGATERRDAPAWLGLHRSQSIVMRLSALFALDAFGGGFILQSILVDWFHLRFGADPEVLGSIFFVANLLAAGSALVAGSIKIVYDLWLYRAFVSHRPAESAELSGGRGTDEIKKQTPNV